MSLQALTPMLRTPQLRETITFYTEVLEFRVVNQMKGAAFLQAAGSANDHDLGLFTIGSAAADSGAGSTTESPRPSVPRSSSLRPASVSSETARLSWIRVCASWARRTSIWAPWPAP